MAATAESLARETWAHGLRPDPALTVSAWADEFRQLSTTTSAEPGPFQTARTPYLQAPMDCLSPLHPCEAVVMMKGAQIGATEAGNNWIGYIVDRAPGPMLAVSPTVDMAKRFSKQRIDSLFEDTPVLRGKVKERRERDSGNTRLSKDFPGGLLVLTGANSAVGLRSMPARYLFLDEVDGYPQDADDEGDPVFLARRATRTFPNRKLFVISTPKVSGLSRIEHELEQCERRCDYHVPCPHCGHRQKLEWERFRWPDGKPRECVYVCQACEQPVPEHHKTDMLRGGQWVDVWNRGERTIGFHLSALYSPAGWFSWADAAEMYERARDKPELMRVFQNTVLGLPFAEEHDAPDWRRLYDRRETYPLETVPPGVRFLTAGADVQKDRIEVEVVGWGRGKVSWSIAYRVLHGDTGDAGVWGLLAELLATDWPCAGGGTLPIRVLGVDSGYASTHVYKWCREFPQPLAGGASGIPAAPQPRTVAAMNGLDNWSAMLLRPGKAEAGKGRGLKLWNIGVSVVKRELYDWLRLERPTAEQRASGVGDPPGYCHVPEYGEEWFRQLTAERLVKRVVRGFPKLVWEKDAGARNEALDCRVYARAAAALFGLDRMNEGHWRRLEGVLPAGLLEVQTATVPAADGVTVAVSDDVTVTGSGGETVTAHPPDPEPPRPSSPPPRGRRVYRSTYLTRKGW